MAEEVTSSGLTDLAKDGGYRSRKMVMAYVAMLLGSAGFGATAMWPSLGTVFSTYCMFLLGASGIFTAGNAAVKWMAAAQGAKVDAVATAPKPSIPVAAKTPAVTTKAPANPNAD